MPRMFVLALLILSSAAGVCAQPKPQGRWYKDSAASTITDSLTRPAASAMWVPINEASVGDRESMPAKAVFLLRVNRTRRPATEDVFSLGYNFKMFGVEARPVAAKMIDFFVRGDWPNKKFISQAMGVNQVPITLKSPIAVAQSTSPIPAGLCLSGLGPEPFFDWRIMSHFLSIPHPEPQSEPQPTPVTKKLKPFWRDWKVWASIGVIAAANIADAKTTVSVFQRCPYPHCRETSHLLGAHPSARRVWLTTGLVTIPAESAAMLALRHYEWPDARALHYLVPAMSGVAHGIAARDNARVPAFK